MRVFCFHRRLLIAYCHAWIAALCTCQLGWSQQVIDASPEIVVTVDGKPFSFEKEDDSVVPHIVINSVALRLVEGAEFHFTRQGERNELIYCATPGQPKRLVGVNVPQKYTDDDVSWTNPLLSLSNGDLRGLWGLRLDSWSDNIAEKLRNVNFDGTCVSIGEGVLGTYEQTESLSPNQRLPILPAEIVDLIIDSRLVSGFDKYQSLANLRALAARCAQFDCSSLASAMRLETLRISDEQLENTDALQALIRLQTLDLSSCENLTEIFFVKEMRELRHLSISDSRIGDVQPVAGLAELRRLDISSSRVRDLSPLNGLKKLELIEARRSAVSKLPGSLPSLRKLNAICCRLSDDEIDAFQKQNPDCQFIYSWNQSLTGVLSRASAIQLRSWVSSDENEHTKQVLYESQNAVEIQRLIEGIQLIETAGGGGYSGIGIVDIEFYDGGRQLASLSLIGGKILRWNEVWPGDGELTPLSQEFLVNWLARRNENRPLEELRESERSKRSHERESARAIAGMSPTLVKSFHSLDREISSQEDFRSTLAAELPEKPRQVEALLRLFGASNESWFSSSFIDETTEDLLREYDNDILVSTIENALDGSDRQLRRGAARLWKNERFPIIRSRPKDISKLRCAVVLVEQEARFRPLRIAALQDLEKWKDDFTQDQFDERLAAGLYDPEPQVRRQAMIVAGQTRHTGSIDQLMETLKGMPVQPRPLAAVPLSESENVSENCLKVASDCLDAEVAALALSYLEYQGARTLIEAIDPRTPMHEVALALFGDLTQLKPEHFGSNNKNKVLRLAAVHAVVRAKGRIGLDLVIDHQWGGDQREEKAAATALGEMLRAENAPGIDQLGKTQSMYSVKTWYEKFGAQYLSRFTAEP